MPNSKTKKEEEDDEQRIRERLKRRQESRRKSQSDNGDPERSRKEQSESDDSSRENGGGPDNRSTQQKRRDRRRRRERRRRNREERRNFPPPPHYGGRYPHPPPHPPHYRDHGPPPPPPHHHHLRGPPPPYRGGPEGPRWERYGPSPHMRGYAGDHWRGPPDRRGPPPPHWRGGPQDRNPRYHPSSAPGGRRSRSRSYSSRSRSRSRSYSSRSRSRSRSSSRSVRHRSHSNSSRSHSSVDSRGSSSDESSLGEMAADNALTKDQRTVFVSQLVMRAEEKDLRKYFRKKLGCKVNEVIMLRDKRTGRHKGCAYVELGRLEDVPKAVEVSGIPPDFQRFPIMVKGSEAEKNYLIANGQGTVTASMMGERGSAAVSASGKLVEAQKVYLGNLDLNVTQEQIYSVFSKFGQLNKVAIQMDPATATSRGFAFLSFEDAKNANLAIQTMAGETFRGRSLKTGWASQDTAVKGVEVVTSTEYPENAVELVKNAKLALSELTTSVLAGRQQAQKAITTTTTTTASTVIEDNGASTRPLPPSRPSPPQDAKVIGSADNPTTNVLVHNMFDKDEETDEGWEEDIKLDFEEECSKYGKLRLVKVMSTEPGGKIYASFESINEAKNCASSLAGRWFDKRQLRVEFVQEGEIPE